MDDSFDTDDLLFDSSSSQNPLEYIWDYNSDDEILEDLFHDGDLMPTSTLMGNVSSNTSTDVALDGGLGASAVLDKQGVLARVEAMLENVLNGLLEDDAQLCITLKTRANLSRRSSSHHGGIRAVPPPRTVDINFPGSSIGEAWRFTVIVRVLEIVHSCLVDNVTMTKRDMYYRHVDLFERQSVVDRYVDDLACTLGVSRSLLNVTAAAKGLVAGNFVIRRGDGTSLHVLREREGILLPYIDDTDTLDLSLVRWIIVIEKEATFHALLSSEQWKDLGTRGFVLTAKGYPDLASRKLLRHVANHAPHVPMFALVDFDPDGIAIMSTYKYGSYRLAHEDVTHDDTPGLNLPGLHWLGVQSHHISRAPADEGGTITAGLADAQGLMRLTARDRRKAQQMLEWDVCCENGPEPAWRAELQMMLMLDVKAEMQILDEQSGGLVAWLSKEIDARQGLGSAVAKLKASMADSDDELLF